MLVVLFFSTANTPPNTHCSRFTQKTVRGWWISKMSFIRFYQGHNGHKLASFHSFFLSLFLLSENILVKFIWTKKATEFSLESIECFHSIHIETDKSTLDDQHTGMTRILSFWHPKGHSYAAAFKTESLRPQRMFPWSGKL